MKLLFQRYEIQKKLGQGSSGEVFLCRDQQLGNLPVAVKVLPAWLLDRPIMRARVASEVLSLLSIKSPYVVSFYDLFCANQSTAIVMEYVEGQSLRSTLNQKEEQLSYAQKFHLAGQLLRGLADIHEKGLIHRDIKPENLIVTTTGDLKIVDLGLVSPTQGTPKEQVLIEPSHNKNIVGTPLYLAPEYVRVGSLTQRADVFAAAMVIFELFVGSQLFEDLDEEQLLEDKSSGKFNKLLKKLPPKFQKFLRKGASPIPARRYPTAKEMLAEFISIESDEGLSFHPQHPARNHSTVPSSLISSSYSSPSIFLGVKALEFSGQVLQRKFSKLLLPSRRALRNGALIASVALLGLGLAWVSQNHSLEELIQLSDHKPSAHKDDRLHVPEGYRVIGRAK